MASAGQTLKFSQLEVLELGPMNRSSYFMSGWTLSHHSLRLRTFLSLILDDERGLLGPQHYEYYIRSSPSSVRRTLALFAVALF